MNPLQSHANGNDPQAAQRRRPAREGEHATTLAHSSRPVDLDTGTVAPYLVRKGILTPDMVVNGRLSVEDISRRNRNFRVRTREGKGFLVKQVKGGRDGQPRNSLLLEAQMLRFIATNDFMKEFRPYAPAYAYFDPRNGVLVTELIHPATSITKLNLYYGKVKFPVDVAEAAGRLLGRYHKAGEQAIKRGHLPFLSKRLPNGLTCPTPQFLLNTGGPSGGPYWSVIQKEDFLQRIPELQKRWQSFDGIVHGDARWMNYLLTHGEAPDGGANLRIIDWEMAQQGDSLWDVACYLGDYVRFAAMLARVHKIRTPAEVVEKPPYPPQRQHKSTQVFWDTYCATRRFTKKQRKDALERVMDYLPFYIALVGYEMTEANASTGREFETMESAHLCMHYARLAAQTRGTFLKEWIGIEQ